MRSVALRDTLDGEHAKDGEVEGEHVEHAALALLVSIRVIVRQRVAEREESLCDDERRDPTRAEGEAAESRDTVGGDHLADEEEGDGPETDTKGGDERDNGKRRHLAEVLVQTPAEQDRKHHHEERGQEEEQAASQPVDEEDGRERHDCVHDRDRDGDLAGACAGKDLLEHRGRVEEDRVHAAELLQDKDRRHKERIAAGRRDEHLGNGQLVALRRLGRRPFRVLGEKRLRCRQSGVCIVHTLRVRFRRRGRQDNLGNGHDPADGKDVAPCVEPIALCSAERHTEHLRRADADHDRELVQRTDLARALDQARRRARRVGEIGRHKAHCETTRETGDESVVSGVRAEVEVTSGRSSGCTAVIRT